MVGATRTWSVSLGKEGAEGSSDDRSMPKCLDLVIGILREERTEKERKADKNGVKELIARCLQTR